LCLFEYIIIMRIVRIILAVIIVFSCVFTAFIGKNKIAEGVELEEIPQYKGIITFWQIDTFEGGVSSRRQFLLKAASMYEKNNDGVLIMVTNHTLEGAENSLKNGKYPDIISFGAGLEFSGASTILTDKKFAGGMIGDKTYFVPWCRGGYTLISNPSLTEEVKPSKIDKLLVSSATYTQPLIALSLENIIASDIEVKPPMDAYIKFVAGKTPYFLATQRDIHRLNNRGMEYNAVPLNNFCDLYQYASVITTDQVKNYYANDFINFLLSERVQKKLSDIGMFSCFDQVEYTDETLFNMQKLNGFLTISAFTQKNKLLELQELSMLSAKGDLGALNKIKNILI